MAARPDTENAQWRRYEYGMGSRQISGNDWWGFKRTRAANNRRRRGASAGRWGYGVIAVSKWNRSRPTTMSASAMNREMRRFTTHTRWTAESGLSRRGNSPSGGMILSFYHPGLEFHSNVKSPKRGGPHFEIQFSPPSGVHYHIRTCSIREHITKKNYNLYKHARIKTTHHNKSGDRDSDDDGSSNAKSTPGSNEDANSNLEIKIRCSLIYQIVSHDKDFFILLNRGSKWFSRSMELTFSTMRKANLSTWISIVCKKQRKIQN